MGTGTFSRRVVSFPLVVNVLLHHHRPPGHRHLPLGRSVHHVTVATPPQHGRGHVALEHAQRPRRVRDVEAQAGAGAQVEEAVPGDPLPQHAARGAPAVLQNRAGAARRDAALQRQTLQDEETLSCREMEEKPQE